MNESHPTTVALRPRVNHCKKPTGWLGRLVARNMNSRHSKVTDWGLSHVSIGRADTILDVGCGGGRTVSKLAAAAGEGKVYGVDHSQPCAKVATKTNRKAIAQGRVEVLEASVSRLPFPSDTFDIVTAVETHFWWPDLPRDLREVLRVLKPGGKLAVIAEVYKGANTMVARLAEKHHRKAGFALLSVDEHRELLAGAGFSDVDVITQPDKGWICCIAGKR